jgi:hypothetical protein
MTLRIEKSLDENRVVFRLSGRISAEHLEELSVAIEDAGRGAALDLEHLTLVDVEGVRFLGACEAKGIELIRCSPYIREWIARERRT